MRMFNSPTPHRSLIRHSNYCSDGHAADVSDFGSSGCIHRRHYTNSDDSWRYTHSHSDYGSFYTSRSNSSIADPADRKQARINVTRAASECSDGDESTQCNCATAQIDRLEEVSDNPAPIIRTDTVRSYGSLSRSRSAGLIKPNHNKGVSITITHRRNKNINQPAELATALLEDPWPAATGTGTAESTKNIFFLPVPQHDMKLQGFNDKADDLCNIGDSNDIVLNNYSEMPDTRDASGLQDMATIYNRIYTSMNPSALTVYDDDEEEHPADALQQRLKNLFLSSAPAPSPAAVTTTTDVQNRIAEVSAAAADDNVEEEFQESMDGLRSCPSDDFSNSGSSSSRPAGTAMAASIAKEAVNSKRSPAQNANDENSNRSMDASSFRRSPSSSDPSDSSNTSRSDNNPSTSSSDVQSSGFHGDVSEAGSAKASYQTCTFADADKRVNSRAAMVRQMMAEVKLETEQWAQVQSLLGDVQEEMAAMNASREQWERRALSAEAELSDLHQSVEEWRRRARDAEELSGRLRAEMKLLKLTMATQRKRQQKQQGMAMEVSKGCGSGGRNNYTRKEYSCVHLRRPASAEYDEDDELNCELSSSSSSQAQLQIRNERFTSSGCVAMAGEASSAAVGLITATSTMMMKKKKAERDRLLLTGHGHGAHGRPDHHHWISAVSMKNCRPTAYAAAHLDDAGVRQESIDCRVVEVKQQQQQSSSYGYGASRSSTHGSNKCKNSYGTEATDMAQTIRGRIKKARLLNQYYSASIANHHDHHHSQQHQACQPAQLLQNSKPRSASTTACSVISAAAAGGANYNCEGGKDHDHSAAGISSSSVATRAGTGAANYKRGDDLVAPPPLCQKPSAAAIASRIKANANYRSSSSWLMNASSSSAEYSMSDSLLLRGCKVGDAAAASNHHEDAGKTYKGVDVGVSGDYNDAASTNRSRANKDNHNHDIDANPDPNYELLEDSPPSSPPSSGSPSNNNSGRRRRGGTPCAPTSTPAAAASRLIPFSEILRMRIN